MKKETTGDWAKKSNNFIYVLHTYMIYVVWNGSVVIGVSLDWRGFLKADGNY